MYIYIPVVLDATVMMLIFPSDDILYLIVLLYM